MRIYNTLTGTKEELEISKENEVKMYACGITVYDLSHIGHARQAIVYSMFVDYLRFREYKVKYVRNYTDVDDKIIKKANELGKNAIEFSKEQIVETEKDMKALHITDADVKPKASEYIPKIIEFVEGLIQKGYAYKTQNGDVYYRVRKFEDYGKLSHRKIDDLLDGVRIENDEQKEDSLDFALWKSAKPGEISWDSPFGKGRPGWHIECSVMALNTLGETIDIHGGGRDLVFPHHENELAQSEAYTGKPFAKIWTHCGLIKINGEKMSKSLGNSLTIRDALKKYNYEVIKFVMVSNHYGTDLDISDENFDLAEKHLYYFYNTMIKAKKFIKEKESSCKSNCNEEKPCNDENNNTLKIKEKFIEAMDDDFGTPLAVANLYNYFRYINSLLEKSGKDKNETAEEIESILDDIKSTYKILGLFEQEPEKYIEEVRSKHLSAMHLSLEDIREKIAQRLEAKHNKDYALADEIRDGLKANGVDLQDTKDGTTWDLQELY